MSSIDRVLTALHRAADALRHAKTHARSAVEKADDGLQRAEALGARRVTEQLIAASERGAAALSRWAHVSPTRWP